MELIVRRKTGRIFFVLLVFHVTLGCKGPDDPPPPPQFVLNVSKNGTGYGTITSSLAGINCGTDCTETYPANTRLDLTPTPDQGSLFKGWSVSCFSTCNVLMWKDQTITATFNKIIGPVLTVQKIQKSGSGTVTSSPSGIDCGIDFMCKESYPSGTQVTLTALPTPGSSYFKGWSGGGCSGTGTCKVTLTSDTTITAEFGQSTSVIIRTD